MIVILCLDSFLQYISLKHRELTGLNNINDTALPSHSSIKALNGLSQPLRILLYRSLDSSDFGSSLNAINAFLEPFYLKAEV